MAQFVLTRVDFDSYDCKPYNNVCLGIFATREEAVKAVKDDACSEIDDADVCESICEDIDAAFKVDNKYKDEYESDSSQYTIFEQ